MAAADSAPSERFFLEPSAVGATSLPPEGQGATPGLVVRSLGVLMIGCHRALAALLLVASTPAAARGMSIVTPVAEYTVRYGEYLDATDDGMGYWGFIQTITDAPWVSPGVQGRVLHRVLGHVGRRTPRPSGPTSSSISRPRPCRTRCSSTYPGTWRADRPGSPTSARVGTSRPCSSQKRPPDWSRFSSQ